MVCNGEASAADLTPVDIEPSVQVRRAHQPVLVEPKRGAAGRCASLAPEDVEVLHDGEPLEVTGFGPRPLPRLHALLIDTSGSMFTSIEHARRSAREYVGSLPADDTAMVAAFDESLFLAAPPTRDRETLERAIDGLTVGHATALWDALSMLVDYVATLPGERVIIVLSDGEDSASLDPKQFERLLDLVAATPDLTVFCIGVQPIRGGRLDRSSLSRLARETGGQYFEIRGASKLFRILHEIHDTLDRRLYVAYVPELHGIGRTRRPKIRVRARPGVPCRVVPLGKARGWASRSAERGALERRAVDSLPARKLPEGCAFPENDEVETVYASPNPSSVAIDESSLVSVVRSRERMWVDATDLATERGPLYHPEAWLESGRLRLQLDRRPEPVARTMSVETPPVAMVVETLRGPTDLLRYLLERELCAPRPTADDPYLRAPFLAHGRTWLALREMLGMALYREYPDYSSWAYRRADARAEAAFEALLQGVPELDGTALGTLRALRTALLDAELEDGAPHTLLAEWLGDVDAVATVLELERAAIRQVLDGDLSRTDADLVERSWERLRIWFAPATAVRVIVPLVPVHDARRGAIGFYRFVLPRPRLDDEAPAVVPRAPLGIATARWLRGAGDLGTVLGRIGRPGAPVYSTVGPRKLRRQVCDRGSFGEHPGTMERVEIALEGDDGVRHGSIVAYFPADGADGRARVPVCVRVDGESDSFDELRRRLPALPGAGDVSPVAGFGRNRSGSDAAVAGAGQRSMLTPSSRSEG